MYLALVLMTYGFVHFKENLLKPFIQLTSMQILWYFVVGIWPSLYIGLFDLIMFQNFIMSKNWFGELKTKPELKHLRF